MNQEEVPYAQHLRLVIALAMASASCVEQPLGESLEDQQDGEDGWTVQVQSDVGNSENGVLKEQHSVGSEGGHTAQASADGGSSHSDETVIDEDFIVDPPVRLKWIRDPEPKPGPAVLQIRSLRETSLTVSVALRGWDDSSQQIDKPVLDAELPPRSVRTILVDVSSLPLSSQFSSEFSLTVKSENALWFADPLFAHLGPDGLPRTYGREHRDGHLNGGDVLGEHGGIVPSRTQYISRALDAEAPQLPSREGEQP